MNQPVQHLGRAVGGVADQLGRGEIVLAEDQRTVVLLIGLEGMRYERVAAILNVPVGTVRSRLARERKELRRLTNAGEVQAPPALWAHVLTECQVPPPDCVAP